MHAYQDAGASNPATQNQGIPGRDPDVFGAGMGRRNREGRGIHVETNSITAVGTRHISGGGSQPP